MYSTMNVSQAAAGLGLTGAFRDGLFSRGLGATITPVGRRGAFRDGVFAALGAIDTLDLSDASAMKEVKVALGIWSPKGVTEGWLANPSWDAAAEAKYLEFSKTFPTEKLTVLVAGHATPNAKGIQLLYLGAGQVVGEASIKASLPILTDWLATTQGAGKVIAPKLASEAGILGSRALIGVGVGVAVVGVAYLLFKKR
jgi:hypothetical protein